MTTISGVNTNTAQMVQQLSNLTRQLDDLQRQLATGQKVDTYSGIPSQAQLVVGLNSQLNAINSFQDSNNTLNARLSIAQTTLTQFDTVTDGVRNSAQQSTYKPSANGQTVDQTYAASQLDEMLSLLNTQADGRYLFSGNAVNTASVASTNAILNGSGTQAGLKQVISERSQADLGVNGNGRLVFTRTAPGSVTGGGAALGVSVSGTANISSPFTSAGGTVVINGTTITIPANSDSTAILNAINSANANATASLNGSNQLVLSSNAAIDVENTSPPVGTVLGEIGLSAGTSPSPPDLIASGAVQEGDTVTLQVGSFATQTITFGTQPGEIHTLADLKAALQAISPATLGGTATVDANGNISVTPTNPGDQVTVGGSSSNSAVFPSVAFGLTAGTYGTSAPDAVTVNEDALSPFGFKLAGVSSNMTGVAAKLNTQQEVAGAKLVPASVTAGTLTIKASDLNGGAPLPVTISAGQTVTQVIAAINTAAGSPIASATADGGLQIDDAGGNTLTLSDGASGATLTGLGFTPDSNHQVTSAARAAASIQLTGTPSAGQTLTFNLDLPDGTTDQLTLTATTSYPPGPNQFTIGSTPGQTAANIQAALTSAFGTLAGTDLTAASAIEAAHNFFDGAGANNAPQRIDGGTPSGPPLKFATALRDGTATDTVNWYTGGTSANARNSVTARIDSAATVNYGMQANEQALRTVIENVAVFAATTFPVGNANSNAAYISFARKIGVNLNGQPGDGTQKTSDIETDLANVQNSIQTVTGQQSQTQVTLQNFVQGITGVSNEQVASEILALQTQLQASLQTTAMLSKLTLTNYLGPA